ncbi:hypothetical protein [Desulfovulcanus sp.]
MLKPVNERNSLSTREAIWQAVRRLREFTRTDVWKKCNCDRSTVRYYLRCWEAAGIIEQIGKRKEGNGRPNNIYRLVRDSLEPPRVRKDGSPVKMGIGRMQMWRAMRILKQFTLQDLVAGASTEEHNVALEEAKTYCRFLLRAGYLRQRDNVFRLVNYTGPKAPMIQRIKRVFDPNLNKVTWEGGNGTA